jgi:two-component system KDP operon response regulator KdpE
MNSGPLILAVDDEASILQFIRIELTSQDFKVITAQNGEDALRLIDEQRPDLVLLDVLMPDMSGFEVLRIIRERNRVPVIILTARRGGADRIRGLDMGADDYLAKPFNPEELTARVRAILRRSGPSSSGSAQAEAGAIVKNGSIEIDLNRRIVTKDGDSVSLTRTEWQLLYYLAQNADRVIPNMELLSRVWSVEYAGELPYLRVWISKLRNKLADRSPGATEIIETFPGVGYMLRSDEGQAE